VISKSSFSVSTLKYLWRTALRWVQSIKICLTVNGDWQVWHSCQVDREVLSVASDNQDIQVRNKITCLLDTGCSRNSNSRLLIDTRNTVLTVYFGCSISSAESADLSLSLSSATPSLSMLQEFTVYWKYTMFYATRSLTTATLKCSLRTAGHNLWKPQITAQNLSKVFHSQD